MEKIKIGNLELMLLLLYNSRNRKIMGRLRLAKLLFIASREIFSPNVEIEKSEFIPYREGPYPLDFTDVIDLAKDNNFIDVVDDNQFILTDKGSEVVESELLKTIELKDVSKQVQEIIRRFEGVSEDILLSYVYLKYPGFATKSEIKDSVFNIIKMNLLDFNKIAREVGITEKEIELELKKARKETLQKISR